MESTAERPFCLEDYRPFLGSLVKDEDESVLIGGLAVSAWAEFLLKGNERQDLDLPIFSKDIDFRGKKITCSTMAMLLQLDGAKMRGLVAATRKDAPHMGRVFGASLFWRENRTSVEVLERLPGLDTALVDPPRGTSLNPTGGMVLLDPCSLFICKMHAANSRPGGQAGNDVKHLRILSRVIPRFLEKLRAMPVEDYDGKVDAERMLRHIEDCEAGRHPFVVPLAAEEIGGLCEALRRHLN